MGLKGFLSGSKPKPVAAPAAAPARVAAPVQAEVSYEPGTWPAERFDVLEEVWGKDCIQPGNVDDVASLMNVCALTSAKTMLDIGSGPQVRRLARRSRA